MNIRDRIREEIVEIELFHTYIMGRDGEKIPRYVAEGYDREKIEAEGSIWIMYVWDCMRDYYEKNKERIERNIDEILKAEIRGR
ncbi:MAG: hypothetical protein DRI61_16275 [Chloroflexi bacterium]|nr:MAG: hypothetical protein DRI61_16275 [Chloroflexota bacterium]